MATQWAEERQQAALGLRLAIACKGSWFTQGYISEAEMGVERLLRMSWQREAQDVPPELRAKALYGFGQILLSRGKIERAGAVAHEFLERGQSSGDHGSISSALAILGQIAQESRHLADAEVNFTECDAHARLGGYPDLRGFTLRNLAEVARMQGDLARAMVLYEEARAVARSLGMTFGVPLITTLLGHLARQQHNYILAKTRYRESLVVFCVFHSSNYIAWCLEGFAAALAGEGQYVQATCLCAAATALREQSQTPLPPAERKAFEEVLADTRVVLDESTFGEEWARGAKLAHDQATDYALSDACA